MTSMTYYETKTCRISDEIKRISASSCDMRLNDMRRESGSYVFRCIV